MIDDEYRVWDSPTATSREMIFLRLGRKLCGRGGRREIEDLGSAGRGGGGWCGETLILTFYEDKGCWMGCWRGIVNMLFYSAVQLTSEVGVLRTRTLAMNAYECL
jgi:hypothetical protein